MIARPDPERALRCIGVDQVGGLSLVSHAGHTGGKQRVTGCERLHQEAQKAAPKPRLLTARQAAARSRLLEVRAELADGGLHER